MLWQLLHVSDLEVVDGYGAVDGGRQEVPALDCVQVQPEQPSPRPSGLRCLDGLCAAELEAEGPVAGENTRRRGLADEGKGLSIYRGNVDITVSADDAQFPACDGPHCYPFCIGKPIRTEPSQSRNSIGESIQCKQYRLRLRRMSSISRREGACSGLHQPGSMQGVSSPAAAHGARQLARLEHAELLPHEAADRVRADPGGRLRRLHRAVRKWRRARLSLGPAYAPLHKATTTHNG